MRTLILILLLNGTARGDEAAVQARAIAKIEKSALGLRLAYSARLCSVKQDRADVLAELAKQKKYARASGVVRLGTLDLLRSDLEQADEKVAAVEELMRDEKVKPMSCKDSLVAQIADCISGYDDKECDEPVAKVLMRRAGIE